MTTSQRKLAEIWKVDAAIAQLRDGATSASISTGGSSQSYTRESLANLERLRARLVREYEFLRRGGHQRTYPDFRA